MYFVTRVPVMEVHSRPLTYLTPSITFCSCRSVAKLDNMQLHSGDMAHIRDRAPVICRGFL